MVVVLMLNRITEDLAENMYIQRRKMMLSTRVRLQSQVLSREENGSCRKYIQTFQMKILHWNKKAGCLRSGNSGRESRNMCKKQKQ